MLRDIPVAPLVADDITVMVEGIIMKKMVTTELAVVMLVDVMGALVVMVIAEGDIMVGMVMDLESLEKCFATEIIIFIHPLLFRDTTAATVKAEGRIPI